MKDSLFEETFDLDSRIPCEDDSCIGVIAASGVCGTCGRRFSGHLSAPVAAERAAEPSPTVTVDSKSAIDPEERIPCSDDSCIGIIGPTGHCGTCGRQA